MHPLDLRFYTEEILTLLYEHVPDWRAAIDAERTRRAEAEALWNDSAALRAQLKRETALRWERGYSANEEARGVDEQDSDRWQAMRARIRDLRAAQRRQRGRLR
jgi:hypothetical protein